MQEHSNNTINRAEDVEKSAEDQDQNGHEHADVEETHEGLDIEKTEGEETMESNSEDLENDSEESEEEIDLSLISDSTSINEIVILINEDEGELFGDPDLYEALQNFIASEVDYNSEEEKLEAGKRLLRRCIKQFNKSLTGIKGTFTHYAIQIGQLLLILKQLVKKCGLKWETWAAENLPFLKDRTRQIYMRIAAIPRVEDFEAFGIDRLDAIASAVKGAEGENPISDFLQKFELTFNPEAEDDIEEFKEKVDLALETEKILRSGIEVTTDNVKQYKQDGKKVDRHLIEVLKAVKNSGGDPNKHLTEPPEEDDDDGEKRVRTFKKLAISLQGTIS
jgi:hypothetical protein